MGALRRGSASSLPYAIQRRLMAYYGLGEQPIVDDFVLGVGAGRERLLVRMGDDGGVDVGLELPTRMVVAQGPLGLDDVCQLVEGVSHFVLVAERARRELPTTQLELELQAEIDKFIVLAVAHVRPPKVVVLRSLPRRATLLRRRLFGEVRFFHPAGTERGDRYRMAHRLAARYTRRLDREYIRRARLDELRATLRNFYCLGQTAKIALAEAA